jgi:hypothetical protein
MVARKRVAFARINVRTQQVGMGDRPFHDVMKSVAAIGVLKATVGSPGRVVNPETEWAASDLALTDNDTILSGVIGFEEQSSLIGEETRPEAGSEHTLVPFAVDIRDDRRWVAFATAQKIRPAGFANAFQAALQAAVEQFTPFTSAWEVDLVTAQSKIKQWVEEHPTVVVFRRTVRYPNPVRDLSDIQQEMLALHARTKQEEFRPYAGQPLDLAEPGVLDALLEGVENGNVDAYLQAEGKGSTKPRFNTRLASNEEWIDDYRDDLSLGIQRVTTVLRTYSARQAGEVTEPPEDGDTGGG